MTTNHKMAVMHSRSLLLPYKNKEEESKNFKRNLKKRRNSKPQRVRLAFLHLILPESDSAFMFELCGALSKSEVPAKEKHSYSGENVVFKKRELDSNDRCWLKQLLYAASSLAATNLNGSDSINLEEIIKDAN